uniref:Uncharacterized protein n=1 Tax=Arundo donax TaxID=35708 RepID=A0A0A9R2L9_ARUDO
MNGEQLITRQVQCFKGICNVMLFLEATRLAFCWRQQN